MEYESPPPPVEEQVGSGAEYAPREADSDDSVDSIAADDALETQVDREEARAVPGPSREGQRGERAGEEGEGVVGHDEESGGTRV